jgi:hypothetical protein
MISIERLPDKPIRSSASAFKIMDVVQKYIALSKLDGWRCLTCIDENGKISFLSRVRKTLPVSKKLAGAVQKLLDEGKVPKSSIIDGEWMKRRPDYDGPECIFMFSPMVLAGEWVGHMPFQSRWEWINSLGLPVDDLTIRNDAKMVGHPLVIPASSRTEFNKFFESHKGMWRTEGVVVYRITGQIYGNRKDNHKSRDMFKIKWREGCLDTTHCV